MHGSAEKLLQIGRVVPSFGKGTRMYAFAKHKARSHAAHDSGVARQGKTLPNAIDSFDASAVRTDQISHLEVLHLIGSPIQLFIRRREKVESADHCLYRLVGKFRSGECEDVDDSGVAATIDHDQSLRGVKHQ